MFKIINSNVFIVYKKKEIKFNVKDIESIAFNSISYFNHGHFNWKKKTESVLTIKLETHKNHINIRADFDIIGNMYIDIVNAMTN